jgi:hypothetical protein
MTDKLLTDASSQLFSRPADEHFQDFDSIMRSARHSQATGEEVTVAADSLIVLPGGDGEDRYRLQLRDGLTVSLCNYSLGQLASGARVPMPLLERISGKTGAQVLNESMRAGDGMTDRKALLEKQGENGDYRLRSLTSESYHRVWDASILEEIERWLLPVGYIPTLPTLNTDAQQNNIMGNNKPALFRGDRDSFVFFSVPPKDDPQDDGFGGLRSGFMVKNSEVGAGSAYYTRFLFRDMCANFLIWGAQDVVTRRQVHRGEDNMRRWILEMRATIQDMSLEVQGQEYERFAKAAEQAFVGDGSQTDENKAKAAQRLQRQFRVTKSVATDAVDAALLPLNQQGRPHGTPDLSHWTVANGLTWEAKDTRYAGKLHELGRMGREVIEAVEV